MSGGGAPVGPAGQGSPTEPADMGTPAEPAGRVVLVTGGSRGIGQACAAWFLEHGDRVVVTSRSGSAGELGAPDRPGSPWGQDRLLAVACDVTRPDQVDAMYATVEAAWGPVEVIVANAGITRDALVLRMTEDAWDEVVATNLTGVFRVVKRGLAKMLRLHRGRIILVSSVVATMGSAGQVSIFITT